MDPFSSHFVAILVLIVISVRFFNTLLVFIFASTGFPVEVFLCGTASLLPSFALLVFQYISQFKILFLNPMVICCFPIVSIMFLSSLN